MIPIEIPLRDSWPILTANSFTATFNAPTLGRYDFGIAANQNQTLQAIKPQHIYIIERVAFSLNIASGVFQEAIDKTNGFPRLKITKKSRKKNIYAKDQPLIIYLNNFETVFFAQTPQTGDELQASFNGQFFQPGAIIGQPTIEAYLQFNIYEVRDPLWIKSFLQRNPYIAGRLKETGFSGS